MKERIAIIDSGIGGLTVFNYLLKFDNNANITYLADNKNFPYGNKSDTELIRIIDRIIVYFLTNNYQKIIIACNTASLIYNKYLKEKYYEFVFPIIESTIKNLENIKNLKNIGVIGTDYIINSKVYEKLIKKDYSVNTFSLACYKLIEYCENNDKDKINDYIKENFNYFKNNKIDTLVLGCTHFNTIFSEINDYFYNNVNIISSGYSLVHNIKQSDFCAMCCRKKIYLTNYQTEYVNKIKNVFPILNNIQIKALNI